MAKVKILPRGVFNRVLGLPATGTPGNDSCWTYGAGVITLDLTKAPELGANGGAIRLEGKGLPERVLVIRDDKGELRAFRNRCTHIGHRRLDPVPGGGSVQCCSVNKSTFDYSGKSIHGPGKKPVTVYKTEVDGDVLKISIP